MSQGAELIARERRRQINEENYDLENDKQYDTMTLVEAGAAYTMDCIASHSKSTNLFKDKLRDHAKDLWPFSAHKLKRTPDDPVKQLVKAGALIAAEIDKILMIEREIVIAESEPQTCPRRSESGRMTESHEDWWERNGEYRCCSFCGSIHPDDLMDIVAKILNSEEGYAITCSSKRYKFYITQPNVTNAGEGAIKYYTPHTPEDKEWLNKNNHAFREALGISKHLYATKLRMLTDEDR